MSSHVEADALLARAKQRIRQGDFDGADADLRTLYTERKTDPLAAVARLLAARLAVGRNQLADAQALVRDTSTTLDPRLSQMARLVFGLLSVRDANALMELQSPNTIATSDAGTTNDANSPDLQPSRELARIKSDEAIAFLEPMDGALPDRAESAEVLCGLYSAYSVRDSLRQTVLGSDEALAQHTVAVASLLPSVAVDGIAWTASIVLVLRTVEPLDLVLSLRALVLVDALAAEGTVWVPNVTACDSAPARHRALTELIARVHEPEVLAAMLDLLPNNSSVRADLATQLGRLLAGRPISERYLAYLADLPSDTPINLPTDISDPSRRLVLGVLAPLSGERASIGASVVRAVQYAVEGYDALYVLPADEGDSPSTAAEAFDSLVQRGANVIIAGVSADTAEQLPAHANDKHVNVWLLDSSRAWVGPYVHDAGPTLEDRAESLAQWLCGTSAPPAEHLRCPLVRSVRLSNSEHAVLLHRAAHDALTRFGLTVRTGSIGTGTHAEPAVFLGLLGREAHDALRSTSVSDPSTRWFEARSVAAGTHGTWFGAREGAAFPTLLTRWCNRTGEAPDELSLLAYDAARDAVASVRPPGCEHSYSDCLDRCSNSEIDCQPRCRTSLQSCTLGTIANDDTCLQQCAQLEVQCVASCTERDSTCVSTCIANTLTCEQTCRVALQHELPLAVTTWGTHGVQNQSRENAVATARTCPTSP